MDLRQKVLNYNLFFGLCYALGAAGVLLLGRTVYGITLAVLASLSCALLNYKRLFLMRINKLRPVRTYIIDTVCITASLTAVLFSTHGSLLGIDNVPHGEVFYSVNPFILLAAIALLAPYQISSRKIARDFFDRKNTPAEPEAGGQSEGL